MYAAPAHKHTSWWLAVCARVRHSAAAHFLAFFFGCGFEEEDDDDSEPLEDPAPPAAAPTSLPEPLLEVLELLALRFCAPFASCFGAAFFFSCPFLSAAFLSTGFFSTVFFSVAFGASFVAPFLASAFSSLVPM